jgi:hypothetical protein
MMEVGKDDWSETLAIGERGFLIRSGVDDQIFFRVYKPGDPDHSFVDYEITNHDCEVVIIDPHAAFHRGPAGDFLDYTSESMGIVKKL